MKLLLRYFRLAPSSMPATHGNDNDARRRRIAEVRRLLAEIAVDPPSNDRCPDQDDRAPAIDARRPGAPASAFGIC